MTLDEIEAGAKAAAEAGDRYTLALRKPIPFKGSDRINVDALEFDVDAVTGAGLALFSDDEMRAAFAGGIGPAKQKMVRCCSRFVLSEGGRPMPMTGPDGAAIMAEMRAYDVLAAVAAASYFFGAALGGDG